MLHCHIVQHVLSRETTGWISWSLLKTWVHTDTQVLLSMLKVDVCPEDKALIALCRGWLTICHDACPLVLAHPPLEEVGLALHSVRAVNISPAQCQSS